AQILFLQLPLRPRQPLPPHPLEIHPKLPIGRRRRIHTPWIREMRPLQEARVQVVPVANLGRGHAAPLGRCVPDYTAHRIGLGDAPDLRSRRATESDAWWVPEVHCRRRDERGSLMKRAEMRDKLNESLEIDPGRTAVIAIDTHRGHLDPEIATM